MSWGEESREAETALLGCLIQDPKLVDTIRLASDEFDVEPAACQDCDSPTPSDPVSADS